MSGYKDDGMPVKNLKSLLQKSWSTEEFKIKHTNWKYLTDPGENFGSLIFAINITLERTSKTELLHVIVKLPPPSPYLIKLFNSPFTFKKEIEFYRDVTPAFIQLIHERGISIPEDSWLTARYFGSRLSINDNDEFDEQASIVLENLNYKGYKMIDRLVGLNRQQTEYAVKKLAQLHAITVAMKKVKPNVFKDLFLPALANAANETAMQCVMDMIKKSLDDLESIDAAKPYMDIVRKTIELAPQVDAGHQRDETWCTCCHNDFWVNNMMFKFDKSGDVIEDMKIVDFQLCTYDYGVKDLIFLLISSPINDIIEDIFDDMVNLYYDEFIEFLKILNINTNEYKKDKLLELVEHCAPLKLAQCLMMTQVIKSKPGSAPKMEAIDGKDKFLQIGGGKEHYDKLFLILGIFRKRNWLLASKK